MRARRQRRRAGFTMLELTIAGTLLIVVLGGLGVALQRGLGMFRQSTANQETDGRLDRALERIQRELLGASANSLAPDLTTVVGNPTTWSNALEFQLATGWAGGAQTLGDVQRIELRLDRGELDNGLDDDGDGLVDDQEVVLIRDFGGLDEQEVVLFTDVAEFLEGEDPGDGDDDNGNGLEDESGLAFDLDGDTLNVRLTVGRNGPQGLILRTRTASLSLRN